MLICEGMTPPDEIAELDMAALFALWVERVADYNEAAALIEAERSGTPIAPATRVMPETGPS